MGSQVREVIESLQKAIKMKKKEFRHKRGKAYLPDREEEEEDLTPIRSKAKDDENERDEEGDSPPDENFKKSRQSFMRRERPKKEGPQVSFFESKKAEGHGRRPEPKPAPGKGKA